jgi:hypothetical protein
VPLPKESPPGAPSSGSEVRALLHRRPSWPLAALAALIVFLSAAAVGLLNRDVSTPTAAPLSAPPPKIAVLPPGVRVDLRALVDVHAVIETDGQVAFSGRLDRGDVRSFAAERRIDLELEWGNSVRLTVNGTDLGTPGHPNQPFLESFDPSSYRNSANEKP